MEIINIDTIDRQAVDTITLVGRLRQTIADSQRELDQFKDADTAEGELYLLCTRCGTKWPCIYAGQTGHTQKAIHSVKGKQRYVKKADVPDLQKRIENRKRRELLQDRILRCANAIQQTKIATVAATQAVTTDIAAVSVAKKSDVDQKTELSK